MNIQDVKGIGVRRRRKKRVGCGPGSGHGKTSGRGVKGAKARSGSETGLYFEGGQMPLVRRIPKRGFKNIFKKQYNIINLGQLQGIEGKDVIDIQALKDAGLLGKESEAGVKILGKGELKRPLRVFAHKFSKSAIKKITDVGGEAKVL